MKKKGLIWGLIAVFLISALFMGGCVPTQEPQQPFDWSIIIFLVLIFGMMYLVLIRPQRKRQKEHQQLVEELRKGDKVVTTGGIYGAIESLSEDSVIIKVESGATMRVAKGSVSLKQER